VREVLEETGEWTLPQSWLRLLFLSILTHQLQSNPYLIYLIHHLYLIPHHRLVFLSSPTNDVTVEVSDCV
jgi:hypothetical protein